MKKTLLATLVVLFGLMSFMSSASAATKWSCADIGKIAQYPSIPKFFRCESPVRYDVPTVPVR